MHDFSASRIRRTREISWPLDFLKRKKDVVSRVVSLQYLIEIDVCYFHGDFQGNGYLNSYEGNSSRSIPASAICTYDVHLLLVYHLPILLLSIVRAIFLHVSR